MSPSNWRAWAGAKHHCYPLNNKSLALESLGGSKATSPQIGNLQRRSAKEKSCLGSHGRWSRSSKEKSSLVTSNPLPTFQGFSGLQLNKPPDLQLSAVAWNPGWGARVGGLFLQSWGVAYSAPYNCSSMMLQTPTSQVEYQDNNFKRSFPGST
jgi:hypothetical protein